jgi:hypothetical protein
MKKVITLQNGSNLNEKQFIKYFESKVFYTLRKFQLFNDLKSVCVKDLVVVNKIGKVIISKECLDDLSVSILEVMMSEKPDELKKLLPKYKGIIRPFYLMSREEMTLYSKIRKLKYVYNLNKSQVSSTSRKKNNSNILIQTELSSFLDSLEKQQKNVKNSIVSSLLKIENLA